MVCNREHIQWAEWAKIPIWPIHKRYIKLACHLYWPYSLDWGGQTQFDWKVVQTCFLSNKGYMSYIIGNFSLTRLWHILKLRNVQRSSATRLIYWNTTICDTKFIHPRIYSKTCLNTFLKRSVNLRQQLHSIQCRSGVWTDHILKMLVTHSMMMWGKDDRWQGGGESTPSKWSIIYKVMTYKDMANGIKQI